jgi:polyisoprenoid-binding protein YceI
MRKTFLLLLSLSIVGLFFQSCKNTPEGEAAVTTEAGERGALVGEIYSLDSNAMNILWEGSSLSSRHNGTILISGGKFAVQDALITGGNFTLDMGSITVLDLTGEDKASLEGHLKGTKSEQADNFFNVSQYPTADFVITKSTKLENDPMATHMVYGNLTMKGETKEVGFKVDVKLENDMFIMRTPQFVINRTDWGVKYNSASVFDNIGDKAINDNIGLIINLVANKSM